MPKRKRVVISVSDKYDIIKRLEEGETAPKLAKEYNISKTTIHDIRNNKTKIINFIAQLKSTEGSTSRKSMKPPMDIDLDNALYTWFTEKRSQRYYITGPILREMAIELNRVLGGPSNFQASSGWLKSFKARHSIQLPTQGQTLYASSSAAESFKMKLWDMLKGEGYSCENVYNADETWLNWKALPRKTLDAKPDPEGSNGRITAMICANATGSHQLPILVIGNEKKPLCFKHNMNISAIPIIYTSQKNACMDSKIFTEWFLEVFVPCVKARQLKDGKREKILLLIDNAPTHPSCDILNNKFELIKVMFIPSCSASLQPMEQGVIENFKGFYRKLLLRKLLLEKQEKGEESLLQVHNNIDLKDASYIIGAAWDSVTEHSLKKAWNDILGLVDNSPSESEIEEKNNLSEILDMLKELNCHECCEEDVQEWINSDGIETGHERIQKSENVYLVTIAEGSNSMDTSTSDSEDNDEDIPGPSEAFSCLDTALRWVKVQDENNLSQLITAVKKVRDLAARKRV
ncbi:hypothetical protein ABMA27_004918 [Loxostege sticticalis]|uniref:HTH CENPB-type domain-containing protein n=1 Tax=Loxostege sticticalis TaxID=481309 RepID=A0ABR3HL68_LOXSC